MANAKEVVAKFHKKYPNAPKKIASALFLALPWQKLENLTTGPSMDLSWEETTLVTPAHAKGATSVQEVLSCVYTTGC